MKHIDRHDRSTPRGRPTTVRALHHEIRAGAGNGHARKPGPDEDAMPASHELFCDDDGRPRVLRGVAVYSGSTRLAEMAARIGFETVWIEMEHGPPGFEHVEAMCMAIETGGAIPTVRVPDGE